ncbi:MAG: hypothetical protein WAV05_01340 [Anaerolineales bacterium]
MTRKWTAFLVLSLILAGCATSTPEPSSTLTVITAIPVTVTPRITMLPTWTPENTPTPKATNTPRNTSTPLVTPSGPIIPFPSTPTTELLVDRPTSSQLPKPANLVTLQYDPSIWSLNTSYPTKYMGYALTHRSIYHCLLEPSIGQGTEGYEVEHYRSPLGATTYEIDRVSQAGVLAFANYCTGEGEDYTCYQLTPGDDHEACTQAAESVLSTFKLVSNPFFGQVNTSPNHWACQDAAGTVGLCQISYSILLNALAFTPDGQAWVAGDDGILLHREGQVWTEISSPAVHPLYDLSLSSPVSGWAVGAGAQVLKWDGNGWSEVLPYHGPGEGPGGSTQALYAVDAYTVNDAWMVGAMKGIDGKTSPYALHWDGSDLVRQNAFPECNGGLDSVLVLGQDNVYAAGGSDLGAMIFHWDGSTWSSTLMPGADHLYTLIQSFDGTLWAGGIEVARDQSDTRGVLFRGDGSQWLRVAVPPLTGGIYALSVLPTSQLVLGGDFTALRSGLEWQPIITDIAGFGWIVDMEQDPQNNLWALTRSGNIFKLGFNH